MNSWDYLAVGCVMGWEGGASDKMGKLQMAIFVGVEVLLRILGPTNANV